MIAFGTSIITSACPHSLHNMHIQYWHTFCKFKCRSKQHAQSWVLELPCGGCTIEESCQILQLPLTLLSCTPTHSDFLRLMSIKRFTVR